MEEVNYRQVFDDDNFDAIAYINSRFPDENSLGNLDAEIAMLKEELAAMNEDLVESIHNHALSNTQLQQEIQVAHTTTKEVIEQIAIIKSKAEKSEELVFDMCKDIKSLDTAKKNLTHSITALKKFIMMLTAVDKLRDCCANKVYKEVANLITAFNELSTYISKYQNIPQIQELYKEKDEILTELKLQLREDFEAFYNSGTSLTAQDMSDACEVVETLGIAFQKEIIEYVCGLLLNPYKQIFANPENQTLEKHEKRFGWLTTNLMDFEKKWENVFPEYWTIVCKLIHEFCSLTFVGCIGSLERYARTTDAQIFMKALSSTINFETRITKDMEKKYKNYMSEVQLYLEAEQQARQQPSLQQQQQHHGQSSHSTSVVEHLRTKKEFVQTRLPNFKGTISKAFEQYLSPYTDKKRQDLEICIEDAIAEEKIESDLKVLNSYLVMQSFIRQLIAEASSYGMNQLMIEISRVIKNGLRFYSAKLIRRIESEFNTRQQDVEHFQATVGYIINTAECWKENISGLEESIKNKLDKDYHDNVDIANDGDLFSNVINKGMEYYLQFVSNATEDSFVALSRLNWSMMEGTDAATDSNKAIKEVKLFIIQHTSQVRQLISEVYLLFYLKKLVNLINQKFMNTLYKLKQLGEGAVPQLMVDATELEGSLVDLVRKDDSQSKTITNYVVFVKKAFSKTKNVLKLLNMPASEFVDNFVNFFEDATVADLDKLLVIKGIKKIDVPQLVKAVSRNG